MNKTNTAYLAFGTFLGVGLVFYQIDTPKADKCETYKVSPKPVTAYVLKPPPAEVRYEACPQTTAKVDPCVLPKAENDTQPDLNATDDTQKPRRHRRWRYHRVRRYWR